MTDRLERVEHRVETAHGALFAVSWTTADAHDAAPILLLHDSLGCVTLWRDFPAALAQATARRVVAYDRLGFGRSDPHPAKLGLDFIRDEPIDGFAAVRRAFALERFVLFGHSVGGGMAIAAAARHADACDAVVTEAAQTFVEDRTLEGLREAQRTFADPERVERLRRLHGDKTEWVLSAWLDTWLAPEFAHWSLDADFPRVSCRVLAIHGDQDEYGSLVHPHRIATRVSGTGRKLILSGCGHVPHRERERDVLAAVRAFLARE